MLYAMCDSDVYLNDITNTFPPGFARECVMRTFAVLVFVIMVKKKIEYVVSKTFLHL